MNITILIDYLIISSLVSIGVHYLIRNIAKNYDLLVDFPDKSRKFHKDPTPLTGGLSIILALFMSGKLYLDINELNGFLPLFTSTVIFISFFLVLVFLIDDMYEIKPQYRLVAQCVFTYYVIHSTGIYLESFGNLFGLGDIYLGDWGIPITIFCVVGVMNAFNMIDGINGLCAASTLIIMLFVGFSSNLIYDSMLVLMIGSILGFLVFNLRVLGKKRSVFLGDSGSNLMGFLVAWMAIYSSQNQFYYITPITTVWFIAIPLLDCIGLIFSRTFIGKKITDPGRDHIHHKLMKRFTAEVSLLIIITAAIIINIFAILMENNFNENISFYIFLLFAAFYYFFTFFYFKESQENL